MLYDKERLDAAYAKVGLFADSAWAVNDADGYYKANQVSRENSEKFFSTCLLIYIERGFPPD